MPFSLKKSSIQISIEYSNGNYTSNLRARNSEFDKSNGINKLILDLEGNLRTNNKSTNSYYDAKELIEDYKELKSVQIFDATIISNLRNLRDPSLDWLLEIRLGNKLKFNYPIEISGSSKSIDIIIKEV